MAPAITRARREALQEGDGDNAAAAAEEGVQEVTDGDQQCQAEPRGL